MQKEKKKSELEVRYHALSKKERHKVLHYGFRVMDAAKELPVEPVGESAVLESQVQTLVTSVLEHKELARLKELELELVRIKALYESQGAELERLREKDTTSSKYLGRSGEQEVFDTLERLYPRSTVRDISGDRKHRGDLILETFEGNVVYEVKNRAAIYSTDVEEFREHAKEVLSSSHSNLACVFVSMRCTIPNMSTFHVEETPEGLLVFIGKSPREPDNLLECRLAVVTEWALKRRRQIVGEGEEQQMRMETLVRQAHSHMSMFTTVQRDMNALERAVKTMKETQGKMEKTWLEWISQAIHTTRVIVDV